MFFFIFLLFLAQTLCAGDAFALSVDRLRLGVHPDKTRLVLDMSAPGDFRVFVLSDPYRMVIDLPEFEWRAPPVEGAAPAGIRGVRYGKFQPGISRIIFELGKPAAVRSAFIMPRGEGKPDRLVIDFAPVSAPVFNREKNKVLGTLGADNRSPRGEPAYRDASLNAAAPPAPQQKTKKPVIVIDPGHGGVDPGATGVNDIFEKNVTLALGRELKKQLEESGQYRVLMTRDSDVFIKLGDRVKFARKHEADLFVSIHADSIEKPGVGGASIYTLSDKASDAQTAALAARENRADLIAGIDLSMEDEDVANILVDLARRDTMNQSRFFANRLVDMLRARDLRVLDTPHRYAGFAVLKAPDIPSILVEAGFMSNRKEAEQLNSPPHRKKFAGALKSGIDAYFEQVRKSRRP